MFTRIDEFIFYIFNGLAGRNDFFDTLAASFTKLSPLLFFGMFLVFFFIPSRQQTAMRQTIIMSGLSGVVAVVVSLICVALFYRARPFVALPAEHVRLIVDHAADSSFPSNHTIGSAALAAGMLRSPSSVTRWISVLLALGVGISRLIVGVHWPSDVFLSLWLGALITYGVFALSPWIMPAIHSVLGIVNKVEHTVMKRSSRSS